MQGRPIRAAIFLRVAILVRSLPVILYKIIYYEQPVIPFCRGIDPRLDTWIRGDECWRTHSYIIGYRYHCGAASHHQRQAPGAMIPDLKLFLDSKISVYNRPAFIKDDPVSVPHLFTSKQDIEIAGFFAAIFAWGQRVTIISKCKELLQLMDNAPFQFIRQHKEKDLKRLQHFKHRTFQATDLFYFIEFLEQHYSRNESLENAFAESVSKKDLSIENGLNDFRKYFFSLPHEKRTEKHIASPETGSSCKRLNMFLRWMVRKDRNGVDFGLWKNISPSQLICPLDVHVARVARQLKILQRKQNDWQAAVELTAYLRTLDKNDPVKYDYALFSLGVIEKF